VTEPDLVEILESNIFTTLDGEICPMADGCEYGHYGSDNCCNKDYQNCDQYHRICVEGLI